MARGEEDAEAERWGKTMIGKAAQPETVSSTSEERFPECCDGEENRNAIADDRLWPE